MMVFIERYTLNRAWNDLTDDELMWTPAEGSWTIGPASACTTATPFVTDGMAADFDESVVIAAIMGTGVEPLTTIGWLFWHIGSQPRRAAELDFLGGDHTAASGWTSPYNTAHPIFTTADEAVTAMR